MKKHKYREEIQKRTINPSSDSWEKLNLKLDALEQNGKDKKWPFMKMASVILILISVGFYFYQPKEKLNQLPEIVSPSSKEEILKSPQIPTHTEPESEVASTPDVPPNKQFEQSNSNIDHSGTNEVAYTKSIKNKTITEKQVKLSPVNDTIIEASLVSDNVISEEATMNDEIDQLLHESKIKLIYNGKITSKKLVNSNALLNSVEDDLDKSLKEKLLEKITATIKKDKEVATSKEN